MHDFWTPALVAQAAPAARFLVILRDPLDRYVSGMTHDLSRGQPHGLRLASEHFARGQYVAQLRLLFAHVDPRRTLVLQYERCVEDPGTEIARTYEFLDLDPSHRPERLVGPVNATRFDKHPLTDVDRRSLARAYAAEFDELEQLCPSVDTSRRTDARRRDGPAHR